MKFNIGDKLHISGDIEITGEQSHNNGSYSYNTNTGVAFPAYVLEKLVCKTASVKPQDKPKFAAGCKAKVTANTCGHHMMIGDIVTLTDNTHIFAGVLDLPAWHYKEQSPGFISERDLEPYAEPTAPANKYDAMSDDELVCAVCDMGLCSASKFNIRHADCPFKNTPAFNSGTDCSDYLHAHPELRPVLVQYLAAENAAKEPKPEPKPVKHLYSGKVVCVETHDDFTVGKVYTFKDGKVTDDSWTRRPMSNYSAESLDDWNSRCGDCIVRFVEYKGEAT